LCAASFAANTSAIHGCASVFSLTTASHSASHELRQVSLGLDVDRLDSQHPVDQERIVLLAHQTHSFRT
jgi:hypothetical protein